MILPLFPTFADERINGTISGLTMKITDKFKTEKIIPIQSREYAYASECSIPVPFKIADFKGRPLFDWTFEDKKFVQFNNENQANFQEYFNWLWKELRMPTFMIKLPLFPVTEAFGNPVVKPHFIAKTAGSPALFGARTGTTSVGRTSPYSITGLESFTAYSLPIGVFLASS